MTDEELDREVEASLIAQGKSLEPTAEQMRRVAEILRRADARKRDAA